MPKINVYLPDDLADSVRAAGLPVSAICQRALEQSVRRVTAIRATVLGDLADSDPTAELSQFTERCRAAITLAIGEARDRGDAEVGTEHLLNGMLAEGTNLALHVLRAIDIDPAHVRRALTAALAEPTAPAPTAPAPTAPAPAAGSDPASRFSGAAANALELTVTEAVSLGHNYVGCEHLLLGLLSTPDGTAGQVLADLGVDLRSARRAVVAALSGYAHLRAQTATAPTDASAVIATVVRQELRPILARLDRLEQHAGI